MKVIISKVIEVEKERKNTRKTIRDQFKIPMSK